MMARLVLQTAAGLTALLALSAMTEAVPSTPPAAAETTAPTTEYQPPAEWNAHCTRAQTGDMDEAAQVAPNSVVRELLLRVAAEQRCMKSLGTGTEEERQQTAQTLQPIVEANTVWLKSQLPDHPLFSVAYSGAKGSTAAWLIVQHSDHDTAWQQEILAILRPLVDAQDFRPANYARCLTAWLSTRGSCKPMAPRGDVRARVIGNRAP